MTWRVKNVEHFNNTTPVVKRWSGPAGRRSSEENCSRSNGVC